MIRALHHCIPEPFKRGHCFIPRKTDMRHHGRCQRSGSVSRAHAPLTMTGKLGRWSPLNERHREESSSADTPLCRRLSRRVTARADSLSRSSRDMCGPHAFSGSPAEPSPALLRFCGNAGAAGGRRSIGGDGRRPDGSAWAGLVS